MSFNRSSSIYLLIALLIIVGVFVFALKNNLLSYLSMQVFGSSELVQEMPLQADPDTVINLQVLDNNQFKDLYNQVLYFDFNYVGRPLINKNAQADVRTPTWSPVYLGNANPFFVLVERPVDKQ
ncbi:hypothetical protein JXE04_02140 [Patescibacteria group bacterium]|nr:hypothetical protein [Patescibacteria group bacterium]